MTIFQTHFLLSLEKPEPQVNLETSYFKVKELKVSNNPWASYIDYQSLEKGAVLKEKSLLSFARLPVYGRAM